mgnify:FL=1
MKNLIFIPARFKSKRFPGKLLKKFKGNTMLEIIAEKVLKINFNPVIVSGDKEIIIHANMKNYLNIKSKKKHISGMSRVSEVINSKSPKIVFILFGDELYLTEKQIYKFIKYVKKNSNNNCWHLLTNIKKEDKKDKNVVKCKLNQKKEIIDFCRPYKKKYDYKCVGLFAFKKEVLLNYNKFKTSKRELKMKVEQFKLLDNKIKIKSLLIKNILNSINSVKDLR